MAEDEPEVSEDAVVEGGEPDFLADDGIDLGDDELDLASTDDASMSFSFGGSRDYEE